MSASGLDTLGIVRVLALAGVREGREGAVGGPFTVGDANAAAGATRIVALTGRTAAQLEARDGGKFEKTWLIGETPVKKGRVDRPLKGGAA